MSTKFYLIVFNYYYHQKILILCKINRFTCQISYKVSSSTFGPVKKITIFNHGNIKNASNATTNEGTTLPVVAKLIGKSITLKNRSLEKVTASGKMGAVYPAYIDINKMNNACEY